MTLAQWYMEQAQIAAEIAEEIRGAKHLGYVDKVVLRFAREDCVIHTRLAQQAQERYGEAR